MSSFQFATLDVFTPTRFQGNPLGLIRVPINSPITQKQKLAIAREINYSETVFLHDDDGSSEGRRVDIFVPTAEIPFAGHPTIGTLCYIGMYDTPSNGKIQTIKLRVKAGIINASYNTETKYAEANIPHDVHVHKSSLSTDSMLRSQPRVASFLENGQSKRYPLVSIVNGMTFMLCDLPDTNALNACYWSKIEVPLSDQRRDEGWDEGIIGHYFYTVQADSNDTISKIRTRMFELDIGEDPATGSAACTLAAYLALQAGKTEHEFEIEQGVEMGRPSLIRVRITLTDDKKGVKNVVLSGTAVVVMQGSFQI